MSDHKSGISQILAGLAVSDIDASVEWMSKVLGRTESDRPMDGLATWNLGDAGVLQLVLDAERAGGSTVSITVEDLVATHARLDEAGISFDVDEATSPAFKLGVLDDPDGNSITLVEVKADAL